MTKFQDELPPEIGAKLLTFLREEDGEFHVADMQGLVQFIVEYGDRYPTLLNLVKVNEEFVVEHFERTGEVLPGIKLIKTTTREGDNVTKLEIFQDRPKRS
jgi:hypothetical protein